MKELTFKEKMQLEALERLSLLNVSALARAKFLNGCQVTKSIVDFENETITASEPTDTELEIIRKFEEEYGGLVYYMIEDTAMYPDGYEFSRYTFLYVTKYESDWEMDKEDCIGRCKTVPAYVYNCDDPNYSEITECSYKNVKGLLLSLS